ncbi:MAG: energy-coupling factor ABC transporter ATP-binding protein [Thermodesulfobacteriota bacterium]
MAVYRLENIVHRYGGRPVLSVEDWSVAEGSITGLYGPNGSGKSTLLSLLGFIEQPSAGQIYFKGAKTGPYNGDIRRRVALMPQESYLLKRTVYQNIAYGLRIRGDSSNENKRVRQALSTVGLDADRFSKRRWYELSGGESRRAALAARLVLKPEVLLLDEPTAGVDAASAQMMKKAAADAHLQHGTSIIIASHDMQWLEDICHDIVYMFSGKILGKGGKTFIFGPWEKTGPGLAARRMADGQVFEAQNAPENPAGTAAALEPEDITIHASRKRLPSGKSALKGTLMRLSLEKHSGRVRASVSVGHTEFIVYPDPQTLALHNHQPGASVWVAYHPDRVDWYRVSADQHQAADARHPDRF